MRMARLNKLSTTLALGLGAVSLSSCATVNPAPDFERTHNLIVERSGASAVYDPELESLIEGKVGELLVDGISVQEA